MLLKFEVKLLQQPSYRRPVHWLSVDGGSGLLRRLCSQLTGITEDRFRDSLLISIKLSQQQKTKWRCQDIRNHHSTLFYIQLKCYHYD